MISSTEKDIFVTRRMGYSDGDGEGGPLSNDTSGIEATTEGETFVNTRRDTQWYGDGSLHYRTIFVKDSE